MKLTLIHDEFSFDGFSQQRFVEKNDFDLTNKGFAMLWKYNETTYMYLKQLTVFTFL